MGGSEGGGDGGDLASSGFSEPRRTSRLELGLRRTADALPAAPIEELSGAPIEVLPVVMLEAPAGNVASTR